MNHHNYIVDLATLRAFAVAEIINFKMASTGESGCPGSGFCGLLKKLGLVPDASQGRFHSAVAVYGASSYGLLAVNVFNPELIARYSL